MRLLSVLLCVAKNAKDKEAFKLARYAYDLLHTMWVPQHFQDELDRETIGIRPKPFKDEERLLPFCHRCGCVNLMLNRNCGDCFVWFLLTFEPLPVVEFHLEADITHEEAMDCICRSQRTTRRGLPYRPTPPWGGTFRSSTRTSYTSPTRKTRH